MSTKNAIRMSIAALFAIVAAPPWLAAQTCRANFPVGSLTNPNGDPGRGAHTRLSHCGENCVGASKMHMSPPSINVSVGEVVTFTIWLDSPLGGPNMICASNGVVDWGDGATEKMPDHAIRDCDGRPSSELDDASTGSHVPKVVMTHTYSNVGPKCPSAKIWGNHKYSGDGSCSYDCQVTADAHVMVQ
jgi:hypothetical protein